MGHQLQIPLCRVGKREAGRWEWRQAGDYMGAPGRALHAEIASMKLAYLTSGPCPQPHLSGKKKKSFQPKLLLGYI